MSQRIEWSIPEVGDDELKEIIESFGANWLTSGPKVKAFEATMAERLQVANAIAVSNGSVAIDLVLQAYGIGIGDEVIVPSMTYFATAAAVSRVGAIPVFADVLHSTFNLDPIAVRAAVGPRTKAAIFIDFGGCPADVDGLKQAAADSGILLIQDAAQTLGAVYKGQPMGAQTETSTMSFHMAKIMTTVEGGMIFTHNDDIAKVLRSYRNQGESAKYIHSVLGTNARMTDMAAGIGLSQARKLERFLAERERAARRYDSHFSDNAAIGLHHNIEPDSKHANFLYNILVENRDEVIAALAANDIDYRICYPMCVYDQEVYKSGRALCRVTPSPISEWEVQRTLSLPMAPALTDEQIDRVADVVNGAASGAVQAP